MTTLNELTPESTRKTDTALRCIGPALWIFGMLVWSFLVAGEFTTAGLLAEEAALIGVFAITTLTAILAIRVALGNESSLKPRTGTTVFGTLGLSVLLSVMLALPVQAVSVSNDIGMTLLLMIIGATAMSIGYRLSSSARRVFPRPVRASLLAAGLVLSIGTIVHVLAVN